MEPVHIFPAKNLYLRRYMDRDYVCVYTYGIWANIGEFDSPGFSKIQFELMLGCKAVEGSEQLDIIRIINLALAVSPDCETNGTHAVSC